MIVLQRRIDEGIMAGRLTHIQGREARCHANRYIATASGCSNRGDIDSFCPQTFELYRCHLSHYNWHSRVPPLIGLRIFYCRKIIILNKIARQSNRNPKGGIP